MTVAEVSRLRWRCRRGMKELDIVLTAWLDRHYASASTAERAAFVRLLDIEDPELAGLLLGGGVHGEPECDRVIQTIRGAASS